MSPMPEYNPRPDGPAEELLDEVFRGRVAGADAPMARLRLERLLKQTAAPQRVRGGLRWALQAVMGLLTLTVLGGWAGNLTIKPWDDAQQITVALPADWMPADYPRLTGVMCHHADKLYSHGGHSLIVDYKLDDAGGYYLQLGVLGVDYQTASDWVRELLKAEPELGIHGYSITQPLVPYAVSVGDMLAFRLAGHSSAIESNVVSAWQQRSDITEEPSTSATDGQLLSTRNARIYLITRDRDYGRRVSMLKY